MPKRVPVTAARRFAREHGLEQVVIAGYDGEKVHVVTYGKTKAACKEAAEAGNHYKRALGWEEKDL